MSKPPPVPVSALLAATDKPADPTALPQTSRRRNEFREQKELEEQRKAGTAPAMVDVETGRDINPHIPEFIEKVPWYVTAGGPTLKHQRPHPERQTMIAKIDEWYQKGTTGFKAVKFRPGACENCGAMGHKKRDCFEKPRSKGSKQTGEVYAPDDFIQGNLKLGYDAKRDRWNGYDPATYSETVVKEHEQVDELAKMIKAEKIKNGEIAVVEAADGEEGEEGVVDDDKYADTMEPSSSVDMDSRTRITVRNLRIREDTAKYLYNLGENSPYYDPKSRSMRENPFLGVPGKEKEAARFSGENYIRYTGEVISANEAQVFAWTARQKGIDVHATAEPTKLEFLQRKVREEKDAVKDSSKKELLDKYGGEEQLEAPAKELLLAQTEHYVEYNRRGKVIKGEERPLAKSKYEEDVYVNNHTTVFGSYWRDGEWGYKCCHATLKNSYCVGSKGITMEQQQFTRSNDPTVASNELRPQQAPIAEAAKKSKKEEVSFQQLIEAQNAEQDAEDEEKEKSKKKKDKKRKSRDGTSSSSSSEVEEEDEEELKEKEVEKEEEAVIEVDPEEAAERKRIADEEYAAEKERRAKKEHQRKVKREKRKRQKERRRDKPSDKKKHRKRRHSTSEESSASSSSSDSDSDASSASDRPKKKSKPTSELAAAIKRARKEQIEGRRQGEADDRDRQYMKESAFQSIQKPKDVEIEAHNLVKIHASDPMAAYMNEKLDKKAADKKAK